uniref:ranBP-type and C3HC4-type zinc finger-containing protein 1 isoform X1 n=1 Tax=Myxine glutinosa TaxID=7769 RepID=UPI00359018DD
MCANVVSEVLHSCFAAVLRARGSAWEATSPQPRRLQLFKTRLGCFRLLVRAADGTVNFEFDLHQVTYLVKTPKWHEMKVPGDQPQYFAFHLVDDEEAQKWTSVISSVLKERENKVDDGPGPFKQSMDLGDAEWLVHSELLGIQLSNAISAGDGAEASRLASSLAQCRISLDVKVLSNTESLGKVRLKVIVEDAKDVIGPIYILANRSATVKMLKNQVFKDYGFHPKVQRWIFAQQLVSDGQTLDRLVTDANKEVFLYLLPASKASLTQEELHRDQLALIEDSTGEKSISSHTSPKDSDQRSREESNRMEDNEQCESAAAAPKQVGWSCPVCTLVNLPLRPGCEACGAAAPAEYKVPVDYQPSDSEMRQQEQESANLQLCNKVMEEERCKNYELILQAERLDLVSNQAAFDCPICMLRHEDGKGVTLRECLHTFCRECLKGTILNCEEAEVSCPFGEYPCTAILQEREIRSLVSTEEYQQFLSRGLALAENRSTNSYHCRTTDCPGWCIYEDAVNEFRCPRCNHCNCLTCKALHEGMDCKQYQEDLRFRAVSDHAALQTHDFLKTMVQQGEAMHCPQCRVILQKKEGCDWLRCSMCKTEICWVTKGPRWGPAGPGDTTGGCRCRVANERCHPDCMNCH